MAANKTYRGQQTDRAPELNSEAQDPSLYHLIELRAYQLFQERGDGEGDALEDWLRAEREMLAQRGHSLRSGSTRPESYTGESSWSGA